MNPTEHKVYMCSVCGEYYHAKKQAETVYFPNWSVGVVKD
jgi:hypothetical protein